MGAIDKAYRHQRDMALMLRQENEKLRARIEGWAKATEQLDSELRQERALADDFYAYVTGIHTDLGRVLARYREVRDR